MARYLAKLSLTALKERIIKHYYAPPPIGSLGKWLEEAARGEQQVYIHLDLTPRKKICHVIIPTSADCRKYLNHDKGKWHDKGSDRAADDLLLDITHAKTFTISGLSEEFNWIEAITEQQNHPDSPIYTYPAGTRAEEVNPMFKLTLLHDNPVVTTYLQKLTNTAWTIDISDYKGYEPLRNEHVGHIIAHTMQLDDSRTLEGVNHHSD